MKLDIRNKHEDNKVYYDCFIVYSSCFIKILIFVTYIFLKTIVQFVSNISSIYKNSIPKET
jgi:hypothetical protein